MKKLPVSGPTVLPTLDDYHVWPVKHRHWTFELVEDEDHDLWVNTNDLRLFFDKFPSDKALKAVYHRYLLFDRSTKTHYLSARSARTELLKSRRHPMHQDTLKFVDWFDRNVMEVMAKKRAVRKLDDDNGVRTEYAKTVSGSIPVSQAHPRLDEPTVPFTDEERWAMEQPTNGPRKVYHPDARPVRVGWNYWPRSAKRWVKETGRAFWRGERGLLATFLFGLAVLWLPYGYVAMAIPDSLDWTVSYRRVMWACAALLPIAAGSALIYWLLLTRSLRRATRQRKHRVFAWVFYLLVLPMGLPNLIGSYEGDMLEYWWANVRGTYRPMNVYADPHLGRIRAVGPMDFGSAEALQQVLDANPRFTLLEVESPGGFVVEGMRMARMVSERKMDTVILDECASSCTFVFITGQERYLGPKAEVGFHRSGYSNVYADYGWSSTDHQIARHYERYGASAAFIAKALKEPMFRIWIAPHADMYDAGYANKAWSERKAGY